MHTLLLFCAKYLVFIIGLIAFIYWLTLPKYLKLQMVIFAVVSAIIAGALAKAGAMLYNDPRPFITSHVTPLFPHGADNGFPSDHTLFAGFVAATVDMASRKLGAILLVLALIVGISRVIGHIHHPIDIIGSLVFVLVGAIVANFVTPLISSRLSKSAEQTEDS
jgi:undecaprenyl-diphosphatase